MDSRHMIDQAVFDISFDSADMATEQQHELAGFIRDRLLPLAEEIFGELSERGSVSKIDLLEIDLGDIGYDGYREEMSGRFRERLRATLRDKLREIASAPSALEYTLDRARAEAERLQHFLETGNLARGVHGSAEAFEQMLLRNLESSGADFVTYLRRAPERATIVGRMARQFPQAALSTVLRLLAPERAARLERLADEYLQARLRERPQSTASELMPGIWETLLHELLQGDGRIADAERRFEERMHERSSTLGAAPEPSSAGLLVARLEAALYGNHDDRLRQLWGEVLRTTPETLRAVFAARLGEARARRSLAVALSHEQLLELAALAVPQQAGVIAAQLARPEAQASLADGGKAGLWERVLGVLHEYGALEEKRFERELRRAVRANGSGNAAAFSDAEGGRGADAATAPHGAARAESSPADERTARILQRLRSGATKLEELSADELVQLVYRAVRLNGVPPGGDFERGIERHALQVPDVQAYYREVLRQLLDGGDVDLEQAVRAGAAAPMSGATLLQARLEAAMAQGQADMLEGYWDKLLNEHPALVREAFLRRMGDERLRRKLAAGFPRLMLQQLLELLAPQQSGQVVALLDEIARNADRAVLQAEGWEYTLACLHGAAEGGFEFDAYARGLVRRLATFDAPAYPADTAAYRLLQRLQGRAPQADASGDIRELSGAEPAEFGALLRRLRDGEIHPGLPVLGSVELRLLAAAIVRMQAGTEGNGFLEDIEKHAARANDAQRYYLHVAECLLHERIVDLEQALIESAGTMPDRDPEVSLRQWLGQLLAQTAAGTAGLAPERLDYVREAFRQVMADVAVRRELVSGQPEALMLELAAALQPAAERIVALLRDSQAGRAAREFWLRTFGYLHESGRDSFSARAYLGRMLAFHDDAEDGGATIDAERLTPTEVRTLLEACALEPDSPRGDGVAVREQLHRLLRATAPRKDAVPASREAALRTRFISALDAAAAGEIDTLWNELSQHARMARSVLLERIDDEQLRANLAAKFPESMLAGLLDFVAPGTGELAAMLAQRLRRQGSAEAVAAFWRHALDSLATEARSFSPQRYGRSLADHFTAVTAGQGNARSAAETGTVAAGMDRGSMQAERAAQLQRQVAQRLAGSLGEEVTAQLGELAATYPEMLRELLRQLSPGELRLAAAQLTERENEFLAGLFAELEQGEQLGVPGLSGRQDAAGPATSPAGADRGARAAELEAGLEAALTAQDAQKLDALWQHNRQYATALRSFFRTALDNGRNRSWLAGWLPQARLAELAVLLRPHESQFVTALSSLTGLASAPQAGGVRAAWCELTLEFLGATEAGFERADYVREMVRRLVLLGLDEEEVRQELLRVGAVPDALLPQAGQGAGSVSQPEVGRRLATVREVQAGEARDGAAALASNLESALHDGDQLGRMWDAALRENPALSRSVLAAHLGDDRVRRRLAALLSHGQLLELVRLVAPQRGAAVAALFAGIEVEPANGGKQRFWQTLLGVLHEYDAGRLDGAYFEQALQDIATVPPADNGVVARIESALADGNAGRIAQLWAEALRDDPATLRRTMVALLATTAARRRLAALLSRAQLLELATLIAPRHGAAVAALFSGSGMRAVSADVSDEWQHLLGLLHEYGTRRLDDMRFEQALRHVPQAGAIPGSSGAGMGLYGEVVRRLRGEAGAARLDVVLGELETREPQAYTELMGRVKSGEFTAAFERLDADELARLAVAVVRHNGAPPGGDFEHGIKRHAQLAADVAGYYREVLSQLLDDDAVDLELAASRPRRPSLQVEPEDRAMPEKRAMPEDRAMSEERTLSEERAMSEERTASTGPVMSEEQAASVRPTAFEFGDRRRSGRVEKEVYIANAGLVLAAPYLPHLFGRVGLTTQAGFKDAAAVERAVHLTQYVVNESCDSPEFLLPLNRILCGVPENQPIVREIRITEQERGTVVEMLKAIIAAWKGVGNTSVEGLRTCFLQRAGRLSLMEDGWHLEVEKSTLDVLLDSLPWSFAVVKHSWMPQPLYVEWR